MIFIKHKKYSVHKRKKQTGAVLLIGLILLFIITLVGVSSMQTTILDEKIVSNMQSASLAFHGAETGLVSCESMIQQQGEITASNLGSLPEGWRDDANYWDNNGTESFIDPKLPTNQQPRCIAEFIGNGSSNVDVKAGYEAYDPGSRLLFRLTSYSTGGNTPSEAMLESLFVCPGGCSDNIE